MRQIEHQGNKFYVDDITEELSKKYDPATYKGPMSTIGEFCTEAALGKLMFIARMVGEFVGVDFQAYRKKYLGEQWYDDPDIYSEEELENYAEIAEGEGVPHPVIRVEKFDGKNIYFPTENLVKAMIKGITPLPFEQFLTQH